MKKPIIGILGNLEVYNQSSGQKRSFVNHDYIEAVKDGGGIPFVIPITNELDQDALAEWARLIDGLVVPGGLDIATDLYGEEPCQEQGDFIRHLDITYLTMIQQADRAGKPVFGICKGMQAINVAYGGSLYQDILAQIQDVLQHNQNALRTEGVHHILVSKESFIYQCFEEEKVMVNSLHHQAVKCLAKGFKVTASSADGVIEAIEKEKGTPVIGVQWHPEAMAVTDNTLQKNLFFKFIGLCAKKSG